MATLFAFLNLVSAALFILAIKGLSSPQTAQRGNLLGMIGMALAVGTALTAVSPARVGGIGVTVLCGGCVGFLIAKRISMTSLPQLMAAFHSLVGGAAVLVSAATFVSPQAFHLGVRASLPGTVLLEMSLGAMIGALTLTGSCVAFLKLQGAKFKWPLSAHSSRLANAILGASSLLLLLLFMIFPSPYVFVLLLIFSLLLGVSLISPIGGADMPVIVSMLNSYSGWAAAATGFTLHNPLLIITGALVGSSGAILSAIMCRNMNRSLLGIIFGGTPPDHKLANTKDSSEKSVHVGSVADAAFILSQARSVIIVPGYGMAVAQAQRVLNEMALELKQQGISVRYAIHPVAGRMPGHMNVLLAEADVPYEDVFELEDINSEFSSTDVAFVIGANDITNPAAHNDPTSPIYGMPVLNVEKASRVLFVKRSLGSGYAGIGNELFAYDKTLMILGDAKKVCEGLVKELREG